MGCMEFLESECRRDSIDIIHAKDLDPIQFKSNYWATNKPLLIKGAVEHWPANKKWRDLNYLLQNTSDSQISVRREPINESIITPLQSEYHPLALSDFFRELQDGSSNPIFFRAALLSKESSRLDRRIADTSQFSRLLGNLSDQDCLDFNFKEKMSPARLYPTRKVFIYRNSFTDWHPHGTDSHLLCQICGNKEVYMLPPNEGHQLIKPVYDMKVRSFEAENAVLQSIRQSRPYRVIIEDGDALHIPIYWYHAVRPVSNHTYGISLVHAFGSPVRVNGDQRFDMSRQLYQDTPTRLKPLLLMARLLAFFERNKPLVVA
jgi:hypothetical protein